MHRSTHSLKYFDKNDLLSVTVWSPQPTDFTLFWVSSWEMLCHTFTAATFICLLSVGFWASVLSTLFEKQSWHPAIKECFSTLPSESIGFIFCRRNTCNPVTKHDHAITLPPPCLVRYVVCFGSWTVPFPSPILCPSLLLISLSLFWSLQRIWFQGSHL